MIFRPDIKPPMWGPPDAVQFAVRQNAERMGASVKLLMPFWEYGWGQYDIFGESFVTVDKNKLLWESRGLRFTHDIYQDSVYIYTQRITKPYQYNSIFVIYTPITTTQSATLGGTQQNNYFGSYGTGIYLSGQLKAQSQINNGVELVGNFPNYNQKNYGFVNFGANGELYQDGLLVATGALNNDSGAYNYNYQLGFFATGSGSSTIVFDFEIAFNTVLNYNQIEQLHYEPYALLMPVARPFIFDMAGGGGVYTIGKAGLGYSGAPLYGSLFSEIPSLTSSLSGKDAKGSTTAKPQKASLAFSGQEASTGLLTTIGRSISNFAGQSITIGIVSGTIVSVGQAVFSFVGNAAKGGIKSVIAKFVLTSSTGEVKGNTTTSTPSVGFTYQGNEAKANTKATVDSKSFGLNGRGVIVNGVAEIIRRAVKIIGSSLRRIIG